MEYGPGQGRTDRTAGLKKAKSKGVKRLLEKVLGIEKYVYVFEKYKDSSAANHQTANFLRRSCIFELFFFLLYTLPSFCFFFFIDNSKDFPGRQLSVMIWTAALPLLLQLAERG